MVLNMLLTNYGIFQVPVAQQIFSNNPVLAFGVCIQHHVHKLRRRALQVCILVQFRSTGEWSDIRSTEPLKKILLFKSVLSVQKTTKWLSWNILRLDSLQSTQTSGKVKLLRNGLKLYGKPRSKTSSINNIFSFNNRIGIHCVNP